METHEQQTGDIRKLGEAKPWRRLNLSCGGQDGLMPNVPQDAAIFSVAYTIILKIFVLSYSVKKAKDL
ncbi:hypothetical protein [Sporolactobacillus putidus]|uniref:Uncharacterized protein n=1 Tax=Sporolactobacillus putidus TaxID=492735 RepID=A0A917RY49_9BACL|nr:hypothetical protein [Sporolactobacillus putidus]GGL43424.1 hypothetical protein GCM10007968_04200 [Sporolactobacillus putidus]